MKIYISKDEIYPVFSIDKDGDKSHEISQKFFDWVIATTKEYDKVQEFLSELTE